MALSMTRLGRFYPCLPKHPRGLILARLEQPFREWDSLSPSISSLPASQEADAAIQQWEPWMFTTPSPSRSLRSAQTRRPLSRRSR